MIHAQQADREGNVQLWGLVGVQKEAVLAARRSIVTVEEIVDELEPRPNAVVLPSWVDRRGVPRARRRTPELRDGVLERDNAFYRSWDEVSRDRDAFTAWIDKHVKGTADFDEYCRSAGITQGASRCLSAAAPTIS